MEISGATHVDYPVVHSCSKNFIYNSKRNKVWPAPTRVNTLAAMVAPSLGAAMLAFTTASPAKTPAGWGASTGGGYAATFVC